MKKIKPKVLYITNIPAPYTVDFYNELGAYLDLTVLFERASADNREANWFGVKSTDFKSIILKGMKFGKEQAVCFQVRKYISTEYDLVIVGDYSTPTGMLAIGKLKRKKIPFFIHADGGFINEESRWKYKLKRKLISAAAGCFSSGDITDKYFIYYSKEVPKLYRYPFTSLRECDLKEETVSRSEQSDLRTKYGFSEKFIALFVGSDMYRKGVDILIEAAKYLHADIGIYIVGGEAPDELAARVAENGLVNVHFLPFVSKEVVLNYMKLADVLVFPTRYDVWGLVVNEAMSQGLPVITSNKSVAGLELVKDGENGFIISTEDAKIWAAKISELYNEPEKLESMKKACIDKIKPYTIENMSKIYAKHIIEYCNSKEC